MNEYTCRGNHTDPGCGFAKKKLSIRDISRSEMRETRADGREYGIAVRWITCVRVRVCVPYIAREASLLWTTLNTMHKRGTTRSGLNDEKELGHVADAATRHARVGHGKNAVAVAFPPRKWSARNINRV